MVNKGDGRLLELGSVSAVTTREINDNVSQTATAHNIWNDLVVSLHMSAAVPRRRVDHRALS